MWGSQLVKDVWLEMLGHAASQCKGRLHAQVLLSVSYLYKKIRIIKVLMNRPIHRCVSYELYCIVQRFCANQMRIVIQNSKLGTG